jgi:glycerate kinase
MNMPIWIIWAAVVGAGGHPGGVLAVAAGVVVAVAAALGVAVRVADGVALGEAAGGVAVLVEVHAARTNPSATAMRGRIAGDVRDPLSRCGCGREACTVAAITRR